MMIAAALLTSSLICSPARIINDTDVWNKIDQQSYDRALTRCGELYKHSPCLKVFRKFEENLYGAICGTNKDTNGWIDSVHNSNKFNTEYTNVTIMYYDK